MVRGALLLALVGACSFDTGAAGSGLGGGAGRAVDAAGGGQGGGEAGAGGMVTMTDAPAAPPDAGSRPDARPPDAPAPVPDGPPRCPSVEYLEGFEALAGGGQPAAPWSFQVEPGGRVSVAESSDVLGAGPGADGSAKWLRFEFPSLIGGAAMTAETPPVDLSDCAGSAFGFSYLVFDFEPGTGDAATVEIRDADSNWSPVAVLFPSEAFPDTNDACQVGSQGAVAGCDWAAFEMPVPTSFQGRGFQLRVRTTMNNAFDSLGIDAVFVKARP